MLAKSIKALHTRSLGITYAGEREEYRFDLIQSTLAFRINYR